MNYSVQEIRDLLVEKYGVSREEAIEAVKKVMSYIGADINREDAKESPERVIKAWENFWGRGYREDPSKHVKTFGDIGKDYDEMVLVKDIKVYSHCIHHMAPIIGKAHVAYIPKDGRVLGLSKINRIVDNFARRLQLQEGITTDIANFLEQHLKPLGIAVMIEAEHLCVKTRGVEDQDSVTVTTCVKGVFRDKPEARNEFLQAVKR